MTKGFALAMIAGLGLAIAGSAAFFPTPGRIAVHEGLSVGLGYKAALARMKIVDPGAITANLCTGRRGIGAYADHLGMGWQLMAHTEDTAERRVQDVQMQRVSRRGTATQAECLNVFRKTVLGHYERTYSKVTWVQSKSDAGTHSLRYEVTGQLPDGTQALLRASRDERKGSACTLDIIFK